MSPDGGDVRERFGRTQVRWRHGTADLIVSPPADQRFRTEANIVGVALGKPHRVEFAFDGEAPHRYTMVAGDVQLVPPGVSHHVRWDACQFCLVSIDPEFVLAVTQGAGRGQLATVPRVKLRDPLVEQLVRALGREARDHSQGPDRSIYRESMASALVAQLVFGRGTFPAMRPGEARRAVGARRLRRVIEYIEAHLADELTLVGLAEVAQLSPYHFARLFKSAIGESPYRYVTARRLARATELLAGGHLDAGKVAHRVGVGSARQLRRLFQRHEGRIPAR
jgi:AraC family transcriptional regulator